MRDETSGVCPIRVDAARYLFPYIEVEVPVADNRRDTIAIKLAAWLSGARNMLVMGV